MKLFHKHLHPESLGERIYEDLRSGMEGTDDLSADRLVESLDLDPGALHPQFRGEIMTGLMFGAVMAVERSATGRIANRILAGLKADFLAHLEEQGANPLQRAEWETIIAARFLDYRKALEGYSGFEPPWKLGRLFYWNILGEEIHVAMSVKIATLYLLGGRDTCQDLLNEYGPYLLPDTVRA
jgi:hypothetical protein